jgi:hypothetical protein
MGLNGNNVRRILEREEVQNIKILCKGKSEHGSNCVWAGASMNIIYFIFLEEHHQSAEHG